jgi:hypothetical protein
MAAVTTRHKQLKHKKGPTLSRVPYTNHNEAMTVPAGACANDLEKNNILCECCPLPSIVNFVHWYLGTPEPPANAGKMLYPCARPISSKGKGLMGIHSELVARKKYDTATLQEKSVELDITIHDEDEIKALLVEGEDTTMRLKLTDEELDYRKPTGGHWGEAEVGSSTGWDTIKDMTRLTTLAIHPDAHIVAKSPEHAEVIQGVFRQADHQGWTQSHHPNMVVPTTLNPTATSSTGN